MSRFLDDEAAETAEDAGGYHSEEIPLSPNFSIRKRHRVRVPSDSSSESDHRSDAEMGDVEDSAAQDRGENQIMAELKRMNEVLLCLSKQVKNTERRVKTMEAKVVNPSPSSSTPKSSRNKDVPPEVRVSA